MIQLEFKIGHCNYARLRSRPCQMSNRDNFGSSTMKDSLGYVLIQLG